MHAGLDHARDVTLRADAQKIICVGALFTNLVRARDKTEVTSAVSRERVFIFRVRIESAICRKWQIIFAVRIAQQFNFSAGNRSGTSGAPCENYPEGIGDHDRVGAFERRDVIGSEARLIYQAGARDCGGEAGSESEGKTLAPLPTGQT